MLGKRESVLEIGMNGEQLLTKIDAVLMGIAGASGVPWYPGGMGNGGNRMMKREIVERREGGLWYSSGATGSDTVSLV